LSQSQSYTPDHTDRHETVFEVAVVERGGVVVDPTHCAAELMFDEAMAHRPWPMGASS